MGLVGGSPRPRKADTERITALPLELDSRDARFVTELVSGIACSTPVSSMHQTCRGHAKQLSTMMMRVSGQDHLFVRTD